MGQTNVALEGNVPNGKDPGTNKKSKGTSRNTGLIGGKGGENGKEASFFANNSFVCNAIRKIIKRDHLSWWISGAHDPLSIFMFLQK